MPQRSFVNRVLLITAVLLCCRAAPLAAIDIMGVWEASLDQPRMNFVIEPGDGGAPYDYPNIFFGGRSINVFGFLDTGASGVVISRSSANTLGIPREPGVEFFDIGVGGVTLFDVSQPVRIRAAPTNSTQIDNLSNYQTVYNQSFGPMRVQVGPTNTIEDPLFGGLNVFGMPVMMNKVVVMDPTPVNTLSGLIGTYLYDPGTPFNPSAIDTNPGIPPTSHQVRLSYGDFGRFTETTPVGAPSPQVNHNPFIGPNPLLRLDPNPPIDDTPPIQIGYGGLTTTGSFLLDTGAAASFISTDLAASLNVRYGIEGPGGPQLELFDPADPGAPGTPLSNQFQLPVQGIAGIVTLAGFFLDEMLLHTIQGSLNPNDPNNIRYVGAPVLVHDITVLDPITGESLTLDGIFGMNYLVASMAVASQGGASESPYRWITYDEPNGILGLDLGYLIPEPGTYAMAGCGLIVMLHLAWRRRRR